MFKNIFNVGFGYILIPFVEKAFSIYIFKRLSSPLLPMVPFISLDFSRVEFACLN